MKKLYFIVLCVICAHSVYAQSIWSEGFETGDLAGWTNVDSDGDGNSWEALPSTVATPAEGDFCASSSSWIGGVGPVTPNNYLISPAIDLSAVSGTILIDWKAYGQDQTWADEKYRVVATLDPSEAGVDAGVVLYDGIVGSSGGAYVDETGNLTEFAGKIVHVAFVHYDVTDQFRLNIDQIEVYTSSVIDISVTDIVSPSNMSSCELTNAETVSVVVTNNGGADISNFELSYSINGGDLVTEMVTETITPAASFTYDFMATADMSALGEYEVEVQATLTDDSELANNSFASSDLRNSDSKITVHVASDATNGHGWTITDNESGDVIAQRGAYQWDSEFFDDVCIYSDRCYSFNYVGEMGPGAYLEILLDGQQILGDTDGMGIPAVLEFTAIGGGCAPNEASAVRLSSSRYSLVNSDVDVSFDFKNLGAAAISELTASYTVDGGNPISQTFTSLNVGQGATANATFDTPVTLDAMVMKNIVVTIDQVNGEADNAANNTVESSIIAMTEIPNRAFLVEEGTGTWCPWCPRGAVGVDAIISTYEDAIGIAVHNSDPMDLGDFDDMTLQLVGATGYPFGAVNRTNDVDPGATTLIEAYASERLITVPATISGTAIYKTETEILTVDVNADIFAAVMPGDYTVNVILTEDGVTGTGAEWAQANNYANNAFGPMGGYENLPNPVPAADMVYDHVSRLYMGGFEGDAGSFPSNATFEDKPTYQYTTALDPAWNIENMHAVAILIETSTRRMVNAVSMPIVVEFPPNSNVDVVKNDNIKIYPNPFVDQLNIELDLENTQEVSVLVYNSLGQKVAERNYGELQGKTVLPFNAHNFDAGMYSINILIGNELTSKKVMLSK